MDTTTNAFIVDPFATGQTITLSNHSGGTVDFHPGRHGDDVLVVDGGSEYKHGHFEALHVWNWYTSRGYVSAS